MTYGYLGTLRAHPGRGADVVALLVGGAEALREHGCRSYVVGTATGDTDLVVVSEQWDSKEAHDASLQLPSVKAAIASAMPMLTGAMTGQEYDVVGGLGA